MGDALSFPRAVNELLKRGVLIHAPSSVEIDDSVDPRSIAPGVVIHAGCRIRGVTTSIGPGCEIGREAPVTMEDCQLGHRVELKGGYFCGATFLDGASMGSAAHVRPATLLEEEASGAHAVGLKQTIFLSFVTAGSLINFCDALMAGGTSRSNHSEIGSSYIHFNFSPRQDKATPSLIGDVPRGVFLDQPPIFLGGQGGLVGPVRIAYGTVIPAGTICRQDILEEGRLYVPPGATKEARVFAPGAYRGLHRIVANNLYFLGNLWALHAWYRYVRVRTLTGDPYRQACHEGAVRRIEESLRERLKRMRELADKVRAALSDAEGVKSGELAPQIRRWHEDFVEGWPRMEERLTEGPPASVAAAQRDLFLKEWERVDWAAGHCVAIRSLSPETRAAGRAWLQEIVNSATVLWGSD